MSLGDKIKSIKWKQGIATFILTLLFSGFLEAFFNWTIIDPVLKHTMPTKVKICPYQYPQVHDGKQWIRVNIVNDGYPDINPLDVEYKLGGMEKYEKGIMHSTLLRQGESDYFEIQSELNIDCSPVTGPVVLDFYEDKTGRCYTRIKNTSSKVCVYRYLDVKVYEGSKLLETIRYPYPFFEGMVNTSGIMMSGRLPYESASNKSELVHFPERSIESRIYDISTLCLRGLENRTWCEENGYPVYPSEC